MRWSQETIFKPIKKSNFKIEIFWSEIEVKKFLWNWKIEMAKNAEYDSAWCANHEKLYLSPSKNQILRWKFFGRKLRWKKCPSNWKIELAKMQDLTQRDPLITKNYIWAIQNINFYDRNFLVRNWSEKMSFKLENRIH